ncbi:MAG TPA: patatin-like phospholipase family protein [Flavobacteriales bacterium]
MIFFFPLQLLLLHLKKNHLLLLCWLIFFGYITENLGVKYGIPYLFLFPEYFGVVSFWSFLLLGFSFGGFITAFNLYTYTAHAYRFPFVATIARPFLKFNVNNAVIPGLFALTYLFCSARLQYVKELVPPDQIVLHLTGFIVGTGLFLALALLYFTRTNIDIHTFLGKDADSYRRDQPMEDILPQRPIPPVRQEQRKATRWLRREQRTHKWRVETYLTPRMRILLARSSDHYDKDLLRSVLWQNHINGSIFEVVLLITFIALGAFSDTPFFSIPAGASVFMLFTMVIMLFSALMSWFQGWMLTTFILVAIALNLISLRNDGFLYDAQAYGLDYDAPPAIYDQPTIAAMANDTAAAEHDARAMLPTLEAWYARNKDLPGANGKPKLVIVNTSGGGSRALLWTFRSLQVADSLVGGDLMKRTALMTGSSGGLIGAAYFRALALAQQQGDSVSTASHAHLDRISSDMLNPLGFSFVSNDMFLRYRRVHDGDRSYTLDRGFAFERRLGELTGGRLEARLSDMAGPERRSEIPMLVVNPVSINDGRRLVISALPAAFLTQITPSHNVFSNGQPESIEFSRLYAGQDAGHLKLSSALRMSASFPFITPVVTLPSVPPMRVMDAGLRDNYGYRTTLMFLYTFREWIAQHTSGVVVLQMRDKQKELEVKPAGGSMLGRLMDPVGSVYGNVVRIQDQDYDLMLKQADAWMPVPLHLVDLQLRHPDDEEISLSWHLTAVEKRQVLRTIGSPDNAAALAAFERLMLGGARAITWVPAGGAPPDRP